MPKTSIDPIVARNLQTALERRGRSAYSVANALGHPPNWLYQVIREKAGLLIPSLRKIAEELGLTSHEESEGYETAHREIGTELVTRIIDPGKQHCLEDNVPQNSSTKENWQKTLLHQEPKNATESRPSCILF